WLLGKLMDGIFNVLNNVFGIQNIGWCIIIFTIVIYTLLLPLTIKQQKFSKMSAVMNPEIQKITNKYKGKKDQTSMLKQQDETKLIYEKYGVSPTSGCLPMLVQMPILFGLYDVIRNIPAYVSGIKDAYMPLVNNIMSTPGFEKIMQKIGEAKPIYVNADKFDYGNANTLVDVLYKFQDHSWTTLIDKFPDLETLIHSTQENLIHLNSFLGINIAETPSALFMSAIKTGAVLSIVLAIAIPVLSGLTQYLSIKLMPQAPTDDNNAMAASMKSMNMFMPLFSVFMCFTLPSGLGLYWVASAVVRSVQQALINAYMNRQSIEDLMEKNVNKANKKREKKGISAKNINEMAQKSVRNIENPSQAKAKLSQDEKDAQIKKATEYYNKNAKPGSLASKANMVSKFNDNKKDS
ncbi:MAG: YidC/Oxa1 family membrane protein insertase, partial [Lachnospiraceae bacterium]